MVRLAATVWLLLSAACMEQAGATNSDAVVASEMSTAFANYSEFKHSFFLDEIEINGTRYSLEQVIITPFGNAFNVSAEAHPYPDRDSLFHPCFLSYWIQTLGAIIATVLALKCPMVLMVVLVGMTLIWPASFIGGFQVCRMDPGTAPWWLMAIKSLIVNICPVVPMLLVKVNWATWKQTKKNTAGYFVYFILWANVFWTLFFPWLTDLNFNETVKANWLCGLSLCISLIVHLFAMRRRNVPLFRTDERDDHRVVYGYGTSLSWLICYTVWNGLFVLSLAPGLTLQDVLFWCIMIALYYDSETRDPIEDYFAMARPIQLGAYIGISDWLDLIPYFRVDGIGLDMHRHAYFLFIATFNFLYSLYVMYYEIRLLMDDDYGRDYTGIVSKHQYEESSDDGSECE